LEVFLGINGFYNEEELDPLDGGDYGLGYAAGDSARDETAQRLGVRLLLLFFFLHLL